MNILYVDTSKIDIKTAGEIHKHLKEQLDGDLITLPKDTMLLLDVDLEFLYDLKNTVEHAIEIKENREESYIYGIN